MKVAFFGQLLCEKQKTGIAWSAHNLVLELLKCPGMECVIQYFSFPGSEEKLRELRKYEEAGCRLEPCGWFHFVLYKLLCSLFPVPYRMFFRSRQDITQCFNFTAPFGAYGKCLTVIHDMAYLACPQTVRLKTRYWLRASMKRSCKYADHIITVSEFSKQEIMRYLHVAPTRITVVPNAVDHTKYHPYYPTEQIRQAARVYGISQNYFLYLGTVEPRKNLETLIGAYAMLCMEKEDVPQLVIAGGKGWMCDSIYRKAAQVQLGNRILFTGYVAQEDSPLLMCGAEAFVFPSAYEGFGMPPLEAMACGTPVIVSNTTALPEVVGDAGILADPESEEALCQAMKRILGNKEYREKLRMLGLQRAGGFTWEKSAQKLAEVYKKLCEGQIE
ncbi:MAG: glycosyltransferase family 4 protein [Eubacterium sp.]|nr:glycosyltransferase family 4 protein [Eubacterium sp.]